MRTLAEQWRIAKFDLSEVDVFGEVPEVHVWIEAFLSGVKTLLDLVVQLLSSEGVVATSVHGFHAEKGVYGANVLGSLSRNVTNGQKEVARSVAALIQKDKGLWIDRAIEARDVLTHPPGGLVQVMFRMQLSESGSGLVCNRIVPPTIDGTAIDKYASDTIDHAQAFILQFIKLLRHRGT